MSKSYWVYILCSQRNGTLYTGYTGDLAKRIYVHREKLSEGFTKKYDVIKLVYVEEYGDVYEAKDREICIKRWKRAWKVDLIEKLNPEWKDLYEHLVMA